MTTLYDDAGRVQAIICGPPSEEDRVATARARAEQIGELRPELEKLVEERKEDVRALHDDGKSEAKIAEICDLSPAQVHRIIAKG